MLYYIHQTPLSSCSVQGGSGDETTFCLTVAIFMRLHSYNSPSFCVRLMHLVWNFTHTTQSGLQCIIMSLDNGRLYSQRITLCNQSDTVKIGMCYYVLKMIAGNYCLSTALFYSILTRIYRSKGTIMSYDHAPHVDYNICLPVCLSEQLN